MKRLSVVLVLAATFVVLAAVPAWALISKVLVTNVSPDGGSAHVGVNSNISATFNIRMARSTINNKTFYLKQEGSTAVVPAQVTYAGTTRTATLNPENDLASGATYTAYVKGGRTGVRGAGGQKLGGTTDTTAIFTDARVSWTFTVATPPDTTIDSGPPSLINSRSATFRFSSSESDSTFECSLDGASFASCTSPKSYSGLADGSHNFTVRAIDASGNVDDTPASHTWTVDTSAPAAPSVHLDASSNSGSQNDNITSDNTPTISGTAEAGSTVKIYNSQNNVVASVPVGNGGTWSYTLSTLQDGSYSYTVKATDAASNESQGTSISLTIDTAAPETILGDKPEGMVSSASASFTFSSSESGSTFGCSLDGLSFASCTSPKSYSGLSDGSHTFRVRATDAAGNIDNTPATHTWTVDATAPTINNVAPANTATDVASVTNVRVTFSEAMDEASVEAQGTFTLKQGSSPVEATVTYDSTTKKATLDPSTDLSLNTTYTATLTTEAKDLAGKALVQQRSWTFTTANAPRSVTVTPATLDLSVTDSNPLDLQDCERSALLTVTNNGPGNVTFAEVSITGPDAAHFSDGARTFILNNGPFTVLAGNFFQDQVTFRAGPNPEDRVSSKTHHATLTYKDDTGAMIGNPVSLTATAACLNFG